MSDQTTRKTQRLSATIRLLLLLSATAFVALIVPWFMKDVNASSAVPWRQGSAALMAAILVLNALLVITRTA